MQRLPGDIATLATGRNTNLFSEDVRDRVEEIRAQIGGARVLVIGGAGTIGAATVRSILPFGPAALHVVDHNENSLVELVRDLRSGGSSLSKDFRTFAFDFGSPIMQRLLRDSGPYDLVLNFAASKHVRAEKDLCSLLQLLETNVVKAARLMKWLETHGAPARYFCVSTDKAANPTNLMGASKRVMEHLIFQSGLGFETTSARFANVAFSDGSLLHGFLRRVERSQPIAVPRDTRRYFISPAEAGELCLIAATCAPSRHVVIPRLRATTDLHLLESVAADFVRSMGFEPLFVDEERAAISAAATEIPKGRYPVLLTPLDTSGEKGAEEFVGAGESTVEIGLRQLLAIPQRGADPEPLATLLGRIEEAINDPSRELTRASIVAWLTPLVPELRHAESAKNLDQRM